MAFGGSLQDIALPDILQLLAAQGKNGYLTLRRGQEAVRIGIVDGMAVDVDSSQIRLNVRLGTMLVRAGLLRAPDLERALLTHRATGRKLGQVLVGDGLVKGEHVRKALSIQFLQLIFGVLGWVEGSYDFERAEVDYDREHVEPVGFQMVLMDCMRMIDEWPEVERRMGHRSLILHKVSHATASEAGAALEGIEADVYQRVDGKATIQQIIDRTLHLEFDTCCAIVALAERNLVAAAYEGGLDEADFSQLLQALRCGRGTGLLELESAGTVRTIGFRDGALVHADSSAADDNIGLQLLRSGLVSRRELEAAMQAGVEPSAMGEFLLRRGRFTAAELAEQNVRRMERIVLALFQVTAGRYRFRPGLPSGLVPVPLEPGLPDLVQRAISGITEWSRIAAAVGPLHTRYVLAVAASEADADRAGHGEDLSPLDLASGPDAAPGAVTPDPLRERLLRFAGGLTVAEATDLETTGDFAIHQAIWAGKVLGLLQGGPLARAAEMLRATLSGEKAESSPDGAEPDLSFLLSAPAAAAATANPYDCAREIDLGAGGVLGVADLDLSDLAPDAALLAPDGYDPASDPAEPPAPMPPMLDLKLPPIQRPTAAPPDRFRR